MAFCRWLMLLARDNLAKLAYELLEFWSMPLHKRKGIRMLQLYCRCGYPLWVAARWTGTTIDLYLLDGTIEAKRTQTPLQQCPQCQVVLHPGQLEGYSLPPRPPAEAPQESPDGPGKRSFLKRLLTATETSPKQRGTRRVLVVDDDREVREVLHHWLESEGFQVASARDGMEALALLQREPGGWVILLDLRMPRMDGWAVLHQLQADAFLMQDHKVVLMSASWLLAQEGPPWRSPQVVAAVHKPFDLDQLLALLTDLTST